LRLLGRFTAGVRHAGPRQRWAVRGFFVVVLVLARRRSSWSRCWPA